MGTATVKHTTTFEAGRGLGMRLLRPEKREDNEEDADAEDDDDKGEAEDDLGAGKTKEAIFIYASVFCLCFGV